jgi:hypothetical protein
MFIGGLVGDGVGGDRRRRGGPPGWAAFARANSAADAATGLPSEDAGRSVADDALRFAAATKRDERTALAYTVPRAGLTAIVTGE